MTGIPINSTCVNKTNTNYDSLFEYHADTISHHDVDLLPDVDSYHYVDAYDGFDDDKYANDTPARNDGFESDDFDELIGKPDKNEKRTSITEDVTHSTACNTTGKLLRCLISN